MRELTPLEDALNDINPLTNVNGTPVVTFEDQRDANVRIMQKGLSVGARKMNPDGTVAKSKAPTAAINEDMFFNNRYRLYEDQIEILSSHTTDGWRVIDELQRSGRIPFRQVQVAVIKREGKGLKLVGYKTVTDVEFITDFTHKLDKDAMRQLLPVIFTTPDVTGEDKLPI